MSRIAQLIRTASSKFFLKTIDEPLGRTSYPVPMYIVTKVPNEEIAQEVQSLKQRHKWKHLFSLLTWDDYEEAYDNVMLNFEKNLVYFSEDKEAVIQLLHDQELLHTS